MYEDVFLDVTTALETLGHHHGDSYFQGKWEEKHWMNTPGPLYCLGPNPFAWGIGAYEAPNNVALDSVGSPIIYRQPVNCYELNQIVKVADRDEPQTFGADGDLHWTYEAVREWWAKPRGKLREEVRQLYDAQRELGKQQNYFGRQQTHYYTSGLLRWLDYLKDGMQQYLQVYAFFLDNGRIPTERDTLPEL